MEKILKLYKYVDGVKDTPFPSEEEQAILYSFDFNAQRMGGARTASAKLKHRLCLDDLWSEEVYAEFNGERFFIRSIPSSSKNNTDGRYEHELDLYSETEILNHVYFIDAVQGDSGVDVYKSNSTKIIFTGDVNQFAERLNASLSYSGLDFNVVVDEGITSEDKMVSFEDKYIMSALQEIFNIYELPYYFVGRTIHIGYTQNTITYPLKYGHDEALLSIAKNNANYQVINRITGIGSTDNIPYYYPNESDNREEVEASGKKWITPMPNLMPSIYRESEGAEMFYNAKNNTYPTPEGGYYEFENLYEPNKAKEGKVTFENIKPSIVGMTNASSQRIDMFIDFAYDQNDNDEVDSEGNYVHPYFFAKMRKTDGEYGFNLFNQAIESQAMQISFTSGVCGACTFDIGVGEETQKNIVQVDDSGNLKRDENGNVLWENQVPQDRQNDTSKYEVWIALKKEDSTYGQIMPNATQNLKPSTSDTFVILGINMPLAYIKAAEKKLDESLIKYMWMNNRDKFTFSVKFSRIFFTEHPEILEQLNENSRVIVEYNNQQHTLYVDSYSYHMDADSPLPEIEIDLIDTLTIGQNSLQTALDSIKQDILSSVGGGDFLKQGLKYFLRKDIDDVAKGKIAFKKGLDIGSFSSLVSGGTFRLDSDGKSYLEVDKLLVRMKAIFEELQIKKVSHIGGEQYITPAAIEVKRAVEGDTYYRCYATEDDNISYDMTFAVGDQALSKMADLTSGEDVSNRYYWRLVVNVGKNYIDLSKTDADSGSDIPQVGDTIVSLGNRSDKDRQNAIIISSVSLDSPSIKMLQGIDSYTLTDKDVISQGFDTATNRAFFKIFGDLFAGAPDNSTYIKYDSGKKSLEIKGKFITRGGTDIDTALSDLQNQIDGNIETWFYGPEPTLDNEPAVNWELNSEKDSHLGDLYYSGEGKAYRFQKEGDAYVWKLIQDTDITKALEEAKKAQGAAANAQTAVGDLNEYVDGSFKDSIITNAEAVAIEKYLNTVDESKKSIEGSYLILYANKYLEGTPKSNLKNAYDAVIASINTLVSKINTAIADNATTVQEKNEVDIAFASFNTKQQDYEKAVENANNAIQDKLKSFTDKVASDVAGYEYLKEAFANDTTIEGGVVSTSIVYTGYNNTQGKFVPMSGINGVYLEDAAKGHGISYWAGGNPIDRETYVDPTDIPSDAAKAVIRMDGSGYFANGSLTWTKEGILHADPLSFFVGEEMVGDILKLFSPIYDKSDGTTVIGIQARYPLLVRGGVTQYAGTPLTVTDIFQGLVLDPNTLEWNSKGQLTVKGGAGSGSSFDKAAMWELLGASTAEQINRSHLTTALQGYATESWANSNFPTKLGNGASGTWGIDISGTANYASRLNPAYGIIGSLDTLGDNTICSWNSGTNSKPSPYGTIFQFSNVKKPLPGTSEHWINQIAYGANERIYVRQRINNGSWTTWRTLAYISDTIPQAENSNKLQNLTWSDFFSRKYHYIDYGAQSTSNFYPIFFSPSDIELDCEIHSDNASSVDAYNQNRIHFQITAQGWNDTGVSFRILSRNNYNDTEITIGAIGCGDRDGGIAIWVRGGKRYRLYCNKTPNMKTSDFTYGSNGERYTVGPNLDGGTNSYVNIIWKNDSTRNNSLVAMEGGNVYSATKLQNTRTIWGQLFDGTNNVSGNMTNVGLINDSIRIEGGFDKATIRGNGHGIIFGGGNGYAHCTYAFRPEWGSQSETQCNLIIQNASAATSNPSYITTHEFVNDGTAYHRTRVRVARTDGEGTGIYTNTIYASDWFRSEGNSGWYSETWGGGIYMNDFTWVRTYNGKNFKSDNVVEAGTLLSAGIAVNVFGPVGNSWNNGQGAFQVGIPNDGNQTPILVAYNGPANSNSGTNRYFAIEVLNNGTRDVHFCVTGAETVRMRSNWFEVNGNLYATDNVTGRLIYRDIATTRDSAANFFLDNRPAIKCEQDLAVIDNYTVRPILRWGDAVNNVGYNTRYVIGSVRQGYDWGRIFMAVSNNDNGTSEGCSFSVYGSGYAAVNGNFLATGGITQYSDQRAKTIIEQIILPLNAIANSPAIRFKWNGWKQKDDGKTHIGGIAQYVQRILPEAIYNSDGALTMDYATTGYIFAVNTAKHLLNFETKTDKEINKLKKRVKYLEKQLKKLGYEEIGTLDN